MGQATAIEWTDATWNPVRGCSRVSEGCRNCYAERTAARFTTGPRLNEDPPVRADGPFAGFVHLVNGHPAWTGKVKLVENHLLDPLKWRKPLRIFVNSMSDLWHENLPRVEIARVYAVMAYCQRHDFQVLTKRPEVRYRYCGLESDVRELLQALLKQHGVPPHPKPFRWPLPNVWEGVSVENQTTADERIPLLLQTPAAVRFVSYEPALGPVDFSAQSIPALWGPGRLHWIIVGGESGPGSRPFDIAWARNTVEQCKAAGVACFVKQIGAHVIQDGERRKKADRKGGDWHEWPHDIRVREFPEARA